MENYYIDYTITYKMDEVESTIIEAKSLADAKRALKEQLEEEYKEDFLNVKFNDAHRTSDDARA